MTTKHIVDAHALLWYLEGNPRLGVNAKAVLDDPQSKLVCRLLRSRQPVGLLNMEDQALRH